MSKFARTAIALAAAKGQSDRAANIALARWVDHDVAQYCKGAVGAIGLDDMPELTVPGTSELLSVVRPRTVIGRLPRLRRVPFNRGLPLVSSAAQFGWCTDGNPIPFGAFSSLPASLPLRSCGGLTALTRELSEISSTDAENLVAEELAAGLAEFTDEQFIDPDVAEVATLSPASITNGAPAFAASGTTPTEIANDITQLVARIFAVFRTLDGVALLMSDINAYALSLITTAQGAPMFPDLGASGGSIGGVPTITSAALETNIVAVHQPSILVAESDRIVMDASAEASTEMESAPTPGAHSQVSFWQSNVVGIRVRRAINWGRAREDAVQVLTGADYAPVVES